MQQRVLVHPWGGVGLAVLGFLLCVAVSPITSHVMQSCLSNHFPGCHVAQAHRTQGNVATCLWVLHPHPACASTVTSTLGAGDIFWVENTWPSNADPNTPRKQNMLTRHKLEIKQKNLLELLLPVIPRERCQPGFLEATRSRKQGLAGSTNEVTAIRRLG